MNIYLRYFGIVCLALFCGVECAAVVPHPGPSLGTVATHLTGPTHAIISLLRAICFISGLGLLMGSMVKFSDHRKNPQEITLGFVLVIFLAGVSLLLLAFVPFLGVKTL